MKTVAIMVLLDVDKRNLYQHHSRTLVSSVKDTTAVQGTSLEEQVVLARWINRASMKGCATILFFALDHHLCSLQI